MIKYIYLGGFFPTSQLDEIISKSKKNIQFASNTFQTSIVNGLKINCENLQLITLPDIYSFPNYYKDSYFNGNSSISNQNCNEIVGSFNNLTLINLYSRYKEQSNLLKSIKLDDKDKIVLFVYGVTSHRLMAIKNFKKIYPNSHICLIVPDLPQYMSQNSNPIYLLFKEIDKKFIKNCIKYIDSFVLLNKNMNECINIYNKPWILMEGIYDDSLNFEVTVNMRPNINLLYTGNIDERYGIKLLVSAFKQIKFKNYRLWIRGDGNTKDYILKEAEIDSRIKYFEKMSRNDILLLENKATILINPVSSQQIFTKYFFPSKTMEYLASGKPTIMFNLDCLPDEYKKHIYIVNDESINGLYNMILKIANTDLNILIKRGKESREFIYLNKNSENQIERVISFIKKIL